MNLHALSFFHAVAQCGSVTAAGEKLLISQPAVSKQLKALERELKTTLVERLPRGVRLTPAGEILADYAQRIFALVDDASAAVGELDGLRRGRLRLAASPTIGTYLLPSVLVQFRRRFPGIDLNLEITDGNGLEQRLHDRQIDVALVPALSQISGLSLTPFMTDQFIAIAAPDHPLARRRKATPAQFAQAFIARQLPSATGSLVATFFAKHRLNLRPVLSLTSIEAVKQAVIAGLGVSILSEMAVAPELRHRSLVRLPISTSTIRRPLHAARLASRPQSKAAIAFMCLLKHAVRRNISAIS